MSRAKAVKYKMGTDPTLDAWVQAGEGEGDTPLALWVVSGRYGNKAIWLPKGIRQPRMTAVKAYWGTFAGGE